MIQHTKYIRARILSAGQKFGVRIYGCVVHFNHIHLHVRGRTLIGLQNFFRVVAGHIAQRILSLAPLKPKERDELLPGRRKFWMDLIFSRTVAWGTDFKNVSAYLLKNLREVEISVGIARNNTGLASLGIGTRAYFGICRK